ncbi:MAG: substrate-binding domain-containing protein [Phycisphaerales bacterium]|nr:substrate-binding domain-containing protein [Phycisphaerales bacterium]
MNTISTAIRSKHARLAIAIGAAFTLAAFASCGSRDEGEGAQADRDSSGQQREYVIGLVTKSSSNKVFIPTGKGARDAARALEQEHGIRIRIDDQSPPREDAQQQADRIRQLAASADAVMISVSSASILRNPINEVVGQQGKPVITFDSDAPDSARFAYLGTDNYEAGLQLGKEMAEVLGGRGRVAILTGNPNAVNLQARVRGVQDALAEHPDITIVRVQDNPSEDSREAVQRMEQVHSAESVDGWAMVGGWALYISNALDGVPAETKIVSLDAAPSQLPYVEAGRVQVLLGQNSYQWGYDCVTMLIDYLHNDERPAPGDEIINSPLIRVTRENLSEYRLQLEQWGWTAD